ncbi:trypsin-1-like [Venturia canescens]|uniref:trypsin-1-like n=1 Tax=Venturia canescens TaxID=32260 RepID=UPI001C9D21AE|nr:trypsin-1-like [Venturia canescens]
MLCKRNKLNPIYGTCDYDYDYGRIVGGEPTSIEYHPYQVSLRRNERHTCGGSIISETWILTAAHCVARAFSSAVSIQAGTSNLSSGGRIIEAKNIIVHDDYSSRTSDYDIAVIELEEPLTFDGSIKPIVLAPSEDHYRAGSYATVTGWGLRQIKGSISDQLREVEVPVVSNSECYKLYKQRRITDRMLCAGYIGEGGRDACFGDSGGPLVQNGQQIGIVSWGYECAHPAYPGVYTRVGALRSWINEQTGV